MFDSLTFNSIEDYILFIKYVKTQNHTLDEDNEVIMSTLLNRCERYKVNWKEYFYTPSVNNSKSIRMMRDGTLVSTFDWNKISDLRMLIRAMNVKIGKVDIPVPNNLLYFHSHPEPWGKGVKTGIWNENNLWVKYRHKFFVDMQDPLNERGGVSDE